ncbi:MAG: MazG family protein [Gammaproteobacteria bacterium]|nr:MazG family protein [Gammaproteobacteria bacterium]
MCLADSPETGRDGLNSQWERIKAEERRQVSAAGEPGTLAGVARALPALTRARKLQKRAAHVGFDWGEPEPVIAKAEEELAEFRQELDSGYGSERLEEEFGDFLFACVNIARHAGIDPESALRRANRKFESRFSHIETRLAEGGKRPEDATLEEMDALWEEAKERES